MRLVSASIVGAVLALLLAPAALADWPHQVKWDQLRPDESYKVSSYIAATTEAIAADDFPCTETGWITDILFDGYGLTDPTSFRITFWSDVPATDNEESHPGDQPLHTIELGKSDPDDPLGLGWQSIGELTYKINIPRELWFRQEEGTIYWIGIQAVIGDGFEWSWTVRDRNAETWGDDAAFAWPPDWAPWWHLGWEDETAADLYQGTLPTDWWKSADMCFRLTGIPIPEPASLGLAVMGALALLFRRKR